VLVVVLVLVLVLVAQRPPQPLIPAGLQQRPEKLELLVRLQRPCKQPH
jgi:hypothetical protein